MAWLASGTWNMPVSQNGAIPTWIFTGRFWTWNSLSSSGAPLLMPNRISLIATRTCWPPRAAP